MRKWYVMCLLFNAHKHEERRGSVVEISRLFGGTMLCPWARHFIFYLVYVQPRKTEKRLGMTEKVLTGA